MVVVLGARKGSATCVCNVPSEPQEFLQLHSYGGQVGVLEPGTQNVAKYPGNLTKVRLLAALADDNGPLSLADVALKIDPASDVGGPPIVLILGSCMDSGKTTTAAFVIHALLTAGKKVGVGKITGVGNLGDLLKADAYGASPVVSMMDFGYPTSINLERRKLVELFHGIANHIGQTVGPDGVCVLEAGDGILFRENEILFSDESVKRRIKHIVLASGEALSALYALQRLEHLGLVDRVRMLSGIFANNMVGPEQVRKERPDLQLPIISSYAMPSDSPESWNPERVAKLFLGK